MPGANLILKIAGIAILIMFITKVLESSGKQDYAMTVNLAGLVGILILVIYEIDKALTAVKHMFQI